MVMKSWNPKHCSSQTSGLCCILCGTAAHYRLDYLGFKPQWGQDFLHMSSHAPNKQRSQDFINFTVSSTCNRSFIFWFVLILQHSLSCMGPYIVLTIFLSNILSAFASPTVLVQVSDLWVRMCLSIFARLFCMWLTHPAWWWRYKHPLKCWQTTTRLYRIMTLKTAIFIVTAITQSFTNSLLLHDVIFTTPQPKPILGGGKLPTRVSVNIMKT